MGCIFRDAPAGPAVAEPISDEELAVALRAARPAAIPAIVDEAVARAREKLGEINSRAGRLYGEDGYGDGYLLVLTVDTYDELVSMESINNLSREIMRRRKEQCS